MEADTEPSTLLIVDDDAVDRETIRRALESAVPDSPIDQAGESEEALNKLRRREYLAAFVDYRLPGRSGLELLQQVRREGLTTPVIILTGYGDELLAVEVLKAGAADYLPKSHLAADRILMCLESAKALARGRIRPCRLDRLTGREREVMNLLVTGKSNKQVASELGISRRTVESHRAHIMEKLEAGSLAELVRCVLQAGPQGLSPP